MGRVKTLYEDKCMEVESAAYTVLREAKYLACASSDILANETTVEWLTEARELLNDALAKAAKVREAA